MRKHLVIFTSHFPYYPGEQFFETELIYLAKSFDKIYIVPVSFIKETSKKRIIPENAQTIILDKKPICKSLIYINSIIKEIIHNPQIISSAYSLKKMMSYIYRYDVINDWLKNFIKDKATDEIFLYSYWMSESAYAIAKFKSSKKIYKFTRAHASDLYKELYNPPYLPFRDDIIKNIDKIFVISKNGFDYLNKNYFIDNDKLIISKLGVSDDNSINKESEDNILRIVTCSRLISIKRIPLLVKALSTINDINIEWTHMGNGPEEELVNNLINYLPSNIKATLTGDISNRDVHNFYKNNNVDLFINISQNEGLPVSIMEAISYGIPVIATDVGGSKEIVTKDVGFLLPRSLTPEILSKSIHNFYNLDKIAKKNMRINARKEFIEKYNAEKNYKSFINDVIKLQEVYINAKEHKL